MYRSSFLYCAIAVGSVSLLLSGCSGGKNEHVNGSDLSAAAKSIAPPAAPPPVTIAASPPPAAQIALPLDTYSFSVADLALEDKAVEILIGDCMRAKGFQYVPDPNIGARPAPLHESATYGLTDPAVANAYGYHNQNRITAQTRPPYQTPAYLMALQGWVHPPEDGSKPPKNCTDDSYAIIRPPGVEKGDPNLVGQLAASADTLTQSDPRVVAVLAKWSACMKSAGFTYATPMDASKAFSVGLIVPGGPGKSDTDVTALEKATAGADVRCKAEVNLVATWLGVEQAFEKIAISQNAASLETQRQLNQAQLEKARQTLKAHGQNG